MTREEAMAIMREVLHQVAPEVDLGEVGRRRRWPRRSILTPWTS